MSPKGTESARRVAAGISDVNHPEAECPGHNHPKIGTTLELATQSDFHDFGVDPAPTSEGFDLTGILARRKWIIVACGILGLIIGVLVFLRSEPVYRSQAQVLIKRKAPPNVGFDDRRYYQRVDDDMAHAFVMTSPRIVSKAVTDSSLGDLTSLKKTDNPVSAVLANISATAQEDGANLYVVSYEGSKASDTAAVVKAVVDSYEDFLEASHRNIGRETRKLITEAKDELLRKLMNTEEAYKEFRSSAPLMWVEGQGQNLHQQRQAAIESERAGVLLLASDLEAQLSSVKSAIERGDNIAALALLAQANSPGAEELRPVRTTPAWQSVNTNSRLNDAYQRRSQILPLILQEEELSARYGTDHPKVISIRKRIASTQEFIDKLAAEAESEAAKQEVPDLDEMVDVEQEMQEWYQKLVTIYVESLSHNLTQLRNRADSLDKLFNDETRAAKQLAAMQFQDESFRKDIARTQKLFDAVVKNLDEIVLTEDQEGYVYEVLAEPGDGIQVAPSMPRMLAMSTILASLVGFGLAYLVDLTDQGFHSPMEISHKLHTTVLGHVPVIETVAPSEHLTIDPIVCTFYNPQAVETEAFRAIRTSLFFSASQKRVIQITSPKPGDGKSTIASNLAVTIANSGKSVLLLDADFRRPRQHHIFGLDHACGLASVVNGQAEIADAAVPVDGVENLDVMPCGPRPTNPSELLSSSRFSSILEVLREQYDFLIVDTPPVLAVSDPAAVAAQVDTILLCLQVNSKTRPLAVRAMEILRSHGADISGIVINGVGSRDSSYVYNYHARRYGYDYGEGYGTETNGAPKDRQALPAAPV